MTANRASLGLLVAAVGAVVVALAMYQPWYSVSITPAGAAVAQQQLSAVAQQYGSSTLQSMANTVGSQFSQVAGRPIATVTARESLHHISTLLLFLAGLAAVVAVARLAGVLQGNGGSIAFLGVVAVICVLFRLHQPPNPAPGYISLSLSWGGWVALLGAVAVVVGGLRSPYSRL